MKLSGNGRWEPRFLVLRERTFLWWLTEKDALEGAKCRNKMLLTGFVRGLHKSHPAPGADQLAFTLCGVFDDPNQKKSLRFLSSAGSGVAERYFAGCVFMKEECLQAVETSLDCGDGSLQMALENDEVRLVHATGKKVLQYHEIDENAEDEVLRHQLKTEFIGIEKTLEHKKTNAALINRMRGFSNTT